MVRALVLLNWRVENMMKLLVHCGICLAGFRGFFFLYFPKDVLS